MALHCVARGALLICVSAVSVLAQSWISVGVKGGVPLMDPFADRTFNSDIFTIRNPFGPPTVVSQSTRMYSGSKYFVLGPTLEVRLPLNLAIEADALYRPMDLQIQSTASQRTGSLSSFLLVGPTLPVKVDTWEFSLLAKYRLRLPLGTPYIAAGPSFRAIGASPAEHMSGTGISAGLGMEFPVWHFRVSPEVRYTHWGGDGAYGTSYHGVAYSNQVELLAGFATGPAAPGRISPIRTGWRKHLSVGVKGGLPFTSAFINDEFGRVTYPSSQCGDFSRTGCIATNPTVETYRASRNYLVGPMVELYVSHGFSIEGDALYAPLSLAAPALPAVPLPPLIETYNSWQFPAVGIYRFHGPFVRPYLEGGPTFRSASSPLNSYLSKVGVTAGVGVEATAWKVRVTPEVRFVHWGSDAQGAAPFYNSRRNQAQFLVGLSY